MVVFREKMVLDVCYPEMHILAQKYVLTFFAQTFE